MGDAFSDALTAQVAPGVRVLDGEPTAAVTTLGEVDSTTGAGTAAEAGLWEMTPGTATDVEAEEIFVVLSGRATLTFEADGETVELGPGVVVRLRYGDRTTWTVHETIRKVYLTPRT